MFYATPMASVRYAEIQCKSALHRVHGMPFDWSLNPYRGCRHRCCSRQPQRPGIGRPSVVVDRGACPGFSGG